MPNNIEIFENTLLKLLVRRGPDSDRLSIVLTSGELGYTTDTKRLYIGDDSTTGGILVGNTYAGSATSITTLSPASIGDLAYDIDNFKLYRLQQNDGSSIGDWELIGGVYSSGDNTIVISADNKITAGILSGGNISPNTLAFPIVFNGSNQISLSSVTSLDKIIPRTGTNVELFSALRINGNIYNFPSTGFTANSFLKDVAGDGHLSWSTISLSSISTGTLTVSNGLTATSNGVNVTGTAFNPLTGNVVIGVAPSLSANTMYVRYNGSTSSIIGSRGVLSAIKTSTGKYRFFYPDIGTDYPSANSQIIDVNNKIYTARVTYAGRTECGVEIYHVTSTSSVIDANISVQIIS